MFRFIFICILLWGGVLLHGQYAVLDSIEESLRDSADDTAKVDALNRAALHAVQLDYRTALGYVNEAIGLSTELDYIAGMSEAIQIRDSIFLESGTYFRTLSELDAALIAQTQAETRQNYLIYGLCLMGLTLLLLIFMNLRSTYQKRRFQSELQTQESIAEEKNKALRKAQRKIQDINQELQAANSNLEAVVHLKTDELQFANQQLVDAHHNLDTFIYRFSHDLRGPIARIKGLAQVAREQNSLEEALPLIGLMNEASDRMDQSLRKLISVRELPEMENHPEALDLGEILAQIQHRLNILDHFGEVDLVYRREGERPFVYDREKIRMMLENLIENAWQFRNRTREGAVEVEVSLVDGGDHWELAVRDTGLGIDPEFHERIFELFFRGSSQSLGNGVGLYLVQELVHSLEGSIKVESEPEVYTRFSIALN